MTNVASLMWWEREKLLTEKDREAILQAKDLPWPEIDEEAAETEAGRYELHQVAIRKYHNEEFHAGIL